MTALSIVKLVVATICIQLTVTQSTAVPGRAAVKVTTYDPTKQSRTLSRGGERGGASLATRTMPANQIKLLK